MPVRPDEREVIRMKERRQQTGEVTRGLHEPCVHVAGEGIRVPKICMRNHECWHCSFEQWIEVMEERVTAGYRLPDNRRILPRAA